MKHDSISQLSLQEVNQQISNANALNPFYCFYLELSTDTQLETDQHLMKQGDAHQVSMERKKYNTDI